MLKIDSSKLRYLLKKYFGLNDAEADVLLSLSGPLNSDEICKSVKLTIPSVNRYLNNLIRLGLVRREKVTCNGARKFVYHSVSHDEMVRLIEERIKSKLAEVRKDLMTIRGRHE